MTEAALPLPVREAVDGIREATGLLIRSAESAHPVKIEEAIQQRDVAVKKLRRALDELGETVDGSTRKRIVESLSHQAHDAATALRQLQAGIRNQLGEISEGSRAMRGYAAYSGDPSSLDRSG